MRFNVAVLPAVVAALLLVIATATDSEPPELRPAAESSEVQHVVYVPRFTADLEGDLSPVGDGSTNRLHDFPAWGPRPTPTAVVAATRAPLPAIASVPNQCPALIVETFGVNAPAACRVARCESGWRSSAVGAAGEVGVFQIHPVHFPYLYATYGAAADLSSPVINTAYAYSLSRGGSDWSHWSCKP